MLIYCKDCDIFVLNLAPFPNFSAAVLSSIGKTSELQVKISAEPKCGPPTYLFVLPNAVVPGK